MRDEYIISIPITVSSYYVHLVDSSDVAITNITKL
jgi:hypothetical protein